MRLKKLGTALVIVAALSAGFASSSQAFASTENAKWYVGAGLTELKGSMSVSAEQSGSGRFVTTVSGQTVELATSSVECVFCQIENSGTSALGSGQLRFTGVTVLQPANCTTSSTITTQALSITADWMSFETNYWRLVPTSGQETAFFSFTLSGVSCSLKTAIIAKGSLFLQSEHATGYFASSQTLDSSASINSIAGGNFHVGTQAATLQNTLVFRASGTIFGTF